MSIALSTFLVWFFVFKLGMEAGSGLRLLEISAPESGFPTEDQRISARNGSLVLDSDR